ncbi:MAG: cellulose biosynthesis cyclic di-GMP-binding regulatory protein BcsB [Siculibacillus sp.]
MSVRRFLKSIGPAGLVLAAAGLLGPALDTGRAVAAEAAPSTPRVVAEAMLATEGGTLRRLPSVGRATKLSGETDRLTWPIWLTTAEVAGQPRLRLSYVAAVSVMPEASNMTVFIDDRPVSSFRIASTGTPKTLDVALPAGSLRPGWNSVRVEVEQRHRVECSTASTYELWTEIDRNRSGLVFDGTYAPLRRGLPDIAGIAPDENGRVRIRLVLPQDPDGARLARALRVAQALTIAGGFLDPIVTIVRAPEKGPGIDVVFGAQGGPSAARAATVVTLLDDPDPGRVTLTLPEDAAALDRITDELLATSADLDGTRAGVAARAALGGLPITSGARMTLAELGAGTVEFSGRLFRSAVDLRLPADLYAADYAKVSVRLAGGHVAGLDRSSRLTVRVNGRQAAGAPLDARHGEVFTDRILQIPLSAFRPGHNRLEIEASLPTADDKVCDPSLQIDGPKRFLLVDRTEIAFPTFARIARLPDLAATAAGVLGDLAPSERPIAWVPHPDPQTLSALATFLGRVAAASGRIDVPQIVYRNPPSDIPSALVVGAFGDLPTTVASTVGIEPVAVRDAWNRRPTPVPLAAPVPGQLSDVVGSTPDRLSRRVSTLRLAALPEVADPIVTGSLTGKATPPRADVELVDRWRKSVENPWSAGAFLRTAGTRVEQMLGSFGGTARRETFVPRSSTGLVVAQSISPTGGVWTLLTAPSVAALADGITTVTESERWNELSGAVGAWDQVEEKTLVTGSVSRGFFATHAFDFVNLRLIAAAWATENPIGFVLSILLVTALLGFTTARLVPHFGVKS